LILRALENRRDYTAQRRIDKVTDAVFVRRHPERFDPQQLELIPLPPLKSAGPNDRKLIEEWLQIRNCLVIPTHRVWLKMKAQPISWRPAQRPPHYPDRVSDGFLGRGGGGGPYVWANAGLGQSTPKDEVQRLMTQLQPLFKKNFSRNRILYGPTVGTSVKFRVVADNDFKAEVEREAQRLADNAVPLHLKFAPEKVLEKLEGYYRATGKQFPPRLQRIDENTKLTHDEKAAIFPLLQILTVEKARADADKVGGFFSPSLQEIVFRESQINAGTVAHEMAHAYADKGWHDFINLMRLRGMEEAHKLDEGMTTYIERIVVLQWHAQQPANTVIPLTGYDATFTNRADEFVKQLGKDWAFGAYFGGWIDFTSNAKPEDTLIIGNKTKKKWKWPWRRTTGHFRRVSKWRQRHV
jgi:hypothetical protein